MNRSFLISRLRWPLFLLLIGVIALLHQMHLLTWWHSWPLFLIFWGVMLLLERAAIKDEDLPPYQGSYTGAYPGQYPGSYPGSYPGAATGVAGAPVAAPVAETAIVPVHGDEITHPGSNRDGGQS
jgi:hypothetical protein